MGPSMTAAKNLHRNASAEVAVQLFQDQPLAFSETPPGALRTRTSLTSSSVVLTLARFAMCQMYTGASGVNA